MTKLSEPDRVAVARYLDGETKAEARTAFEARLHAEPALAEALAEANALRGIFACARTEPAPVLRPGLGDRVLQRLQRVDGGTTDLGIERRVVRLARICVVAAAVIFAFAVLFGSGAARLPDSGHLQADASSELIKVLDAKMKAAQPPGVRR